MKFTLLFCMVLVLCMLCGTAFADIMPAKSFTERQPKTHNSNAWGLVY